MQVTFTNNPYTPQAYTPTSATNQVGPLTAANNLLLDVAHNGKIGAGAFCGTVAAVGKIFDRMSTIETLGQSKLVNPTGKQGKELVNFLKENKMIGSVAVTAILPFVITASAVALFLLGINKAFPKNDTEKTSQKH